MDIEKIETQLEILQRIADDLKNGRVLTSGNITHEGVVKGYTIENVVRNIRKTLNEG